MPETNLMWMLFAIFAYTLLAIPAIGDKFLLVRSLRDPVSYAFLVGLLGLLVLPLISVFGWPATASSAVLPAVSAGILFVSGLAWYYRGIQSYETSQIVPLTGGLVPLWGLMIGNLIAPFERLPHLGEIFALILLVTGTLLMSFDVRKGFSSREFRTAALAALCFALSFLLLKRSYLESDFWSGLVWRQVGGGLVALVFLGLFPRLREEVFGRAHIFSSQAPGGMALVLGNQVIGSVATLFLYGAIYSAPALYVPFVNAFQGIQFAFVLFLATLFSIRFPHIFHEYVSPKALAEKVLGTLLIIAGAAALFSYGGS